MDDALPKVTYRFDKGTREHALIVDGHELKFVTDVQLRNSAADFPEMTITFLVGSLNATHPEPVESAALTD